MKWELHAAVIVYWKLGLKICREDTTVGLLSRQVSVIVPAISSGLAKVVLYEAHSTRSSRAVLPAEKF
jgi:hypothetical protein